MKLRGARLVWTCPACGREVSAPLEEEPTPSEAPADSAADPGDVPRCPKCGAPRAERPDCPKCGLVYANWNDGALDIPDALVQAWRAVEASYEDPEAHDAFLDLARHSMRLDAAALLYRRRLGRYPGDSMARTRLAAIARLAEAEALRPSGRRTRKSRIARNLLWGLVVLALLGLLYLLLTATPSAIPPDRETAPAPGIPPPDASPATARTR